MTGGVWVGVDPGSVRTGVAACDRDQMLASPVVTLDAVSSLTGVVEVVAERSAVGVVVGLARSLDGHEGAAARAGRRYAEQLAAVLAVPVFLVDERLTTVGAGSALRAAGHTTRSARAVIDQAAATALLQGVLDAAGTQHTEVAQLLASGLGQLVERPGAS